ncbi:MAG: PAS domain S-box protein [Gammaproteobacteria bacterium]|nr:PAS domain S-box protein [Gammaproteobacteria bacterium]
MSDYNHLSKEQLVAALQLAEARIGKLENTDALSRSVIDTSPVPYAINDDDQNITFLNPAFIRAFGYTLSDIPKLADWWDLAYPDEHYRFWVSETWKIHLDRARQNQTPFEPLELNVRCKDGSSRTILASAAPLGNSYGNKHLVILFDITDRKKNEIRLSEQEKELMDIIDHLPSMIFLKDANTLRYVRFNSAGEQLTGLNRENVIGKTDYDLFPKAQADSFTDRDKIVLSTGEMLNIPDEPIDTPHGTRSLHTRKLAIYNNQGKPKYILGISDDITDRKIADAEHQRMQRELQQAHKMESLGHLTGGIAHDFNNLLGIILGYTGLGHQRSQHDKQEKLANYFNQIKIAGERAANLISQMLAFSRNAPTNNQPMLLGPDLKNDLSLLRATIPSSIHIDSYIENNLPPVSMNPTQLNQILMNLAVNARDAMQGKGRLSIRLGWARNLNIESSVSHQPITGDWIELAVSDTGCGIPGDIIEDIFTPFFTSKGVGEGTGMGLSVVYGIVKGCNGHIQVESKVNTGSTFRIFFPPLLNTVSSKISDSETEDDLKGNRQVVLVVDDEESLARYVRELLLSYNYTPEIYTDSEQALAAFAQAPDKFSLLITDQTMPDLTGLELIEEIRKIRSELPIILCTGYSDVVNPEKAEQLGFEYLQKPLDHRLLLSKIQELASP